MRQIVSCATCISPKVHSHKLSFLKHNELNTILAFDKPFTCMAYGSSGTGKTFTINSLISYSASFLLNSSHFELSALEVYNNDVYDILHRRTKLSRNNTSSSTIIHSLNNFNSLFFNIKKRRMTSPTSFNKHSSRSHLIISLNNFTFIDLAGTEDHCDTQSNNINLSLLSLRDCIRAASSKQQHIPYRNSKLTMCLQNKLSNNIFCICTLSHLPQCVQQNKRTCDYGHSILGLKYIQHKHFPIDDILNYMKHTQKMSKLESEMLISLSKNNTDVELIKQVRKIWFLRKEMTNYMIKLSNTI